MSLAIVATKLVVAASVIGFASWISDTKPVLAGFVVALPLVSILALLFSYLEYKDATASITFAKSIMLGVPASYLFFLPFFLAERLHLGFWASYISGILLLIVGFFLHRTIMTLVN